MKDACGILKRQLRGKQVFTTEKEVDILRKLVILIETGTFSVSSIKIAEAVKVRLSLVMRRVCIKRDDSKKAKNMPCDKCTQ